MIKNCLSRILTLSTKKVMTPQAFKWKNLMVPKFNFSTQKQFPQGKEPGDKEGSLKIDNHHDHTNCSHHHHHPQQTQHHHHHHHHNGQPCNHDHSQDAQDEHIQITPEVMNYKTADHNIGSSSFRTYTTKDAVSILDKIKGNKDAENMQIYALAFTCNVCETRAIRSFTKNAYENGVVLIKCQGCKKVHLIADNLGWFEDEPTNIEKFADAKKVSHSADVLTVLDKLFEESEKPMTQDQIKEFNKKMAKNNQSGNSSNQK